jgi:alpha-N-arabinofuranosidase
MANYAQTVNVIGAIKTTPVSAELETTGLVLKLYRQRFGVTPVEVTGAPAPLDISAAWVADKSALTVAIVNPTDKPASTALAVKGAQLTGQGMSWVIAGASRTAHNDPGAPREVDIRQEPYRGTGELHVPPLSVALFELKVR